LEEGKEKGKTEGSRRQGDKKKSFGEETKGPFRTPLTVTNLIKAGTRNELEGGHNQISNTRNRLPGHRKRLGSLTTADPVFEGQQTIHSVPTTQT